MHTIHPHQMRSSLLSSEGSLRQENGLIFASEIGEPLDRRFVTIHHFKLLLKRAGLPQVRLFTTAREIHALLLKDGQAVPAYIFGHTHNAEQFPIGEGEARYFNSGTWTPLIPHRFDLLTTRELFTFVEVTRYPWQPEEAVPELLLWNDVADRAEPLTRLKLSGQLSGEP